MSNRSVSFALIALLILPVSASAGVRSWLSASGGVSSYSMSDVNDEIANINAQIAGTGLTMEKITSGTQLGAAFGFAATPKLTIGLGYERFSASSDVGDATGGIKYDLPANNVRLFGRYEFVRSEKASGYLDLGLGRISEAGKVTLSVTGQGTASAAIAGSGTSLELGIGGEYWAAPQLGLTGGLGYRHARISSVTVDGERAFNADGSDYTIDFSGLFIRAGVTIALAR